MSRNYAERVIDAINEELPGLEPELVRLYALLAMVLDVDCTDADTHDAWSLWRTETNPGHRSLLPFRELAPEVAELDTPYTQAIRRVGAKLIAPP